MRAAWSALVALLAAGQTIGVAPPTPVIVELFTSEGCSSCPPADTLLRTLIDEQAVPGAQVIGLGLHVDYWDHQGWKDRFSSSASTGRQQAYQPRFNTDGIYTPQMVVDGRAELVGSDGTAARRAIERASAAPHGIVRIDVEPPRADRMFVSVMTSDLPHGIAAPADIVVAITEDHLSSAVKRGENRGRTLTHAAVVRHLTTIGEAASVAASSARAEIALGRDWQRDRLNVVAFVQERRGRTIVASAVSRLPSSR